MKPFTNPTALECRNVGAVQSQDSLPTSLQYLDTYLAANGCRGIGAGLTVSSYLGRVLRGRDLQSKPYVCLLQMACECRVRDGRAIQGLSKRGGMAFYPLACVGDVTGVGGLGMRTIDAVVNR